MASIKGIKLTGIQSHMGMEGYTFYANVTMDGKKVGYVCDDAYGGPWDIGLPEDIRDEVKRRYLEFIKETGKVDEMAMFDITEEEFVKRRENGTLPLQNDPNLEFFFSELAELADTEKRFKSAVKKGYKALVSVKFYPVNGVYRDGYAYMTGGSPKVYADIRKDAEQKSRAVVVTQYDSLDDFNI